MFKLELSHSAHSSQTSDRGRTITESGCGHHFGDALPLLATACDNDDDGEMEKVMQRRTVMSLWLARSALFACLRVQSRQTLLW